MAKITSGSEEKVFRINEWLGLNENPDGDTRLKLGEAAVMRNFKITRDGSLQKRPGLDKLAHFCREYYFSATGQYYTITAGFDYQRCADRVYINKNTGEAWLGETITINADTFTESDDITENILSSSLGYRRFVSVEKNELGEYVWTLEQLAIESRAVQAQARALWSGYIGGKNRIMGIANNCLIEIHDGNDFVFRTLGAFSGDDANASMFGFQDKLYIVFDTELEGVKYPAFYVWDGSDHEVEGTLQEVVGYDPIVAISVTSSKGVKPFGTLYERINLLSAYRRVWLSPESASSTTFYLPETFASIVSVKSLVSGNRITDYTAAQVNVNGQTVMSITFSTETTLLEQHIGENTIEVYYFVAGGTTLGLRPLFPDEGEISAEQYNGTTDNRVFLCSSNSNKVYYSGLDYNGQPRADYFPDLNVISVGESSDTVTGLIRHYSRLIVYKANSTYSIQYGTIGLADGMTTAAFYCTPVNKRIGNEAFGQVRLVLNSPRTLHGKDLYEWRNNSSYSSNLTVDERQARRISDRIHRTLASFDFSKCYCYDDNDSQEYYICFDKRALVHNYAVDAWYYYDNFDVTCMVNFDGELYAGDSQGRFNLVSRTNRTDNGEEITAYWESGSEAFGKEFMRKYSSAIWVTLKPENRSRVVVTAVTDRNGNLEEDVLSPPLAEYTVAASLATFSDADFRAWSFNTTRVPKIFRSKLKAKKFVYYKLIFKLDGTNTTATIVSADIKIRFTGQAR